MAKYNVTYKCGHEGVVNLVGPHVQRQNRIEYLEGTVCPSCYQKEQEELAEKYDKANDLPELTGSEKQVEWARSIRRNCLQNFESLCTQWEEDGRKAVGEIVYTLDNRESEIDKLYQEYADIICDSMSYISEQTTARFFIDNRDDFPTKNDGGYSLIYGSSHTSNFKQVLKRWAEAYRDAHDIQKIEAEKEEKEIEQRVQVTVEPVNKEHDTIVTLRKKDSGVHLYSEYDRDLVDVIHEFPLKMKWNKTSWVFTVEEFRGTFESVMAEFGNILLRKGFIVVFPNQEIADMAVSGNFKRYIRNAFYKIADRDDYIVLKYNEDDDDVYMTIRNIPRANTMSGKSIIDVASYESIEELMEANPDTFVMSDACKAMIESYKKSKMIAKPSEMEDMEYNKPIRKDVDLSDLIDD